MDAVLTSAKFTLMVYNEMRLAINQAPPLIQH